MSASVNRALVGTRNDLGPWCCPSPSETLLGCSHTPSRPGLRRSASRARAPPSQTRVRSRESYPRRMSVCHSSACVRMTPSPSPERGYIVALTRTMPFCLLLAQGSRPSAIPYTLQTVARETRGLASDAVNHSDAADSRHATAGSLPRPCGGVPLTCSVPVTCPKLWAGSQKRRCPREFHGHWSVAGRAKEADGQAPPRA